MEADSDYGHSLAADRFFCWPAPISAGRINDYPTREFAAARSSQKRVNFRFLESLAYSPELALDGAPPLSATDLGNQVYAQICFRQTPLSGPVPVTHGWLILRPLRRVMRHVGYAQPLKCRALDAFPAVVRSHGLLAPRIQNVIKSGCGVWCHLERRVSKVLLCQSCYTTLPEKVWITCSRLHSSTSWSTSTIVRKGCWLTLGNDNAALAASNPASCFSPGTAIPFVIHHA